jgi:hypothetical protein
MLASQFLHVAKNLGAPTWITTLALSKFQFSFFSVTGLFSANIIAQRSWPPLYRRGIIACFVFRREIGNKVVWDFFDSIGHERRPPQ